MFRPRCWMFVLPAIVAVFISLTTALPAAEPGGKIKVLLFQTGGHDWRGFTEILGEMVGKTGDFDVTPTNDLDQLKAESIGKFDVVLFYGSGNNFGDPAQEQGLDAFVRGGGGLAGVHATDAFKKSDVYWLLMGGRFSGHGGGTFPVVIVDRKHPITGGIDDFEISDETYRNKIHEDAELHSLVRIDRGQEQQSMAWVQQIDKGRVFSTTLGHGKAAWASPEFQRLVVRGLYWAAGREPKDP
jgi:type 1 glutamine amidotransferase